MNKHFLFPLVALALILYGCQSKPVCPAEERPAYLTVQEINALSPAASWSSTAPVQMKINGSLVSVDKVVEGPLCNDSWEGTVYIGCNVQVREWDEKPLFFEGCNLSIAEGTIVYVAYHNNAAYYQGCSCHTGR